MQRLFSMFLRGWRASHSLCKANGCGDAAHDRLPGGEFVFVTMGLCRSRRACSFFFLGAFTPVLCALCCCIEIAAIFGLRGVDALHMVFSIVATAALGLLGPGAYSLDARMFGRRRVILSTDESSDVI